MTETTREATIYRQGTVWCYGLIVDGEGDHSDTIGCYDSDSYEEAVEYLRQQLPAGPITFRRVADVPALGMGGY